MVYSQWVLRRVKGMVGKDSYKCHSFIHLLSKYLLSTRLSLDQDGSLCFANISPQLEFKGNCLSFLLEEPPFINLQVLIYDHDYPKNWIF